MLHEVFCKIPNCYLDPKWNVFAMKPLCNRSLHKNVNNHIITINKTCKNEFYLEQKYWKGHFYQNNKISSAKTESLSKGKSFTVSWDSISANCIYVKNSHWIFLIEISIALLKLIKIAALEPVYNWN